MNRIYVFFSFVAIVFSLIFELIYVELFVKDVFTVGGTLCLYICKDVAYIVLLISELDEMLFLYKHV